MAQVASAASVEDGVRGLIANCGLGKLRPNIVLAAWPNAWRALPRVPHDLACLVRDAEAKGKALLIAKHGAMGPEGAAADPAGGGGGTRRLCCGMGAAVGGQSHPL